MVFLWGDSVGIHLGHSMTRRLTAAQPAFLSLVLLTSCGTQNDSRRPDAPPDQAAAGIPAACAIIEGKNAQFTRAHDGASVART